MGIPPNIPIKKKMILPEPVLQAVSQDLYELVQTFTLTHGPYLFIVRAGFRTDGASIPNIFWLGVGNPMQGLVLPAAVIHDALYGSEWLPREKADRIFYDLMIRNGVSPVKSWAFYTALRIGGWLTWRTHTEASVNRARAFVSCKDRTAPPSVSAIPI